MLVFDVVSILDHMMPAVSLHMSRYQLAFSRNKISQFELWNCSVAPSWKYLLPLLCRPPTFEQLVAVCLVTPTRNHDLIPVHSPNVTALIYILYRLNWQTDLSRWIVNGIKRTGIHGIECSSVRIWICIQNVQISSGTGPYFVYISITTLKTHLSIPRYLSSIIHSIFGQIIFIWAQI